MTTGDPRDDTLQRLAGAVADAAPVDWDAECRHHPHLSSTLNALRRIEMLGSAFRAAVASDPGQGHQRPRPSVRLVLPS